MKLSRRQLCLAIAALFLIALTTISFAAKQNFPFLLLSSNEALGLWESSPDAYPGQTDSEVATRTAKARTTSDQLVSASAFTPGNLVACRVGDGTAPLGSTATIVFLDEYTPAGSLVQSVQMPTSVIGSNKILTASGSGSSECQITRSVDGHYILITGYNAALATASVASTSTASVLRVIGRVDSSATVDTSTTTTSFSGGGIRGATSDNGTNLWAVGGNTGVVRTTFAGSGAGTIVSTTITNNRVVNIFGGQLYSSDNSGSVRLGTVGSGLPTTTGQTITNLPGFITSGSPEAFFFADLNPGIAGVDTLYLADDGTNPGSTGGGIKKFSLLGGAWTYNGTFPANGTIIAATAFFGLTGTVSGGTVTLYATRTPSAFTSQLVSFVDSTGYNAAPTAVPTLLTTADSNLVFRGVALAPVASANPGVIDFDHATYSQDESGGTASITLQRTGGSDGAVSVQAALSNGSATGGSSCGSGVDFLNTGSPVTVNFTNGQTTANFNVPICNDGLFEPGGPESVDFTLSSLTGGATLGGQTSGVLNITDDDVQPSIQLSSATYSVGEDGGTATVSVTRSNATENSVSVGYATSDSTAVGGACGALSGNDYVPTSGTLNFASGDTTKTFSIPICDDNLFEPIETVNVALNNFTGATIGTFNTAVLTINENDAAPTVQFSAASVSVGENAGMITLTATRTGAAENAFTVNLQTADGTAVAAPCGGGDYNSIFGPLSFAGGDPEKKFSITICDDASVESSETFTASLSTPDGVAVLGADSIETVTITDNDTPPDTTVDSGPAISSNIPSASFTFGGTDNSGSGLAGFECSLDGNPFAACTSPQNYNSLADGSHTFDVRAKDAVNNIDPTSASYTWSIDTVSPVIATYAPLANTTTTDPRLFNVTVTDNLAVNNVTLYYSVNGSPVGTVICILSGGPNEWLCSTPGVASGSAVAYDVEATDNAGNTTEYPSSTEPNLFTVGAAAVPPGVYSNMSLFNGSTLNGDADVTGTLDLGGVVTTSSHTLELDCSANVTGAGSANFVVGNLRKDFCVTGPFSFPVGENGYTPVAADITALGTNPSSLTVSSFNATLNGFDPSQSLSRTWQIDETGDVTATLSFTYLPADVNGSESDYRVWRIEGNGTATNMCPSGPCVSSSVLGPVSGLTQFSRWTGSIPLAPTAAPASISGQVRLTNGMGVRNAYVTVSGGDLAQPVIAATNSFGHFTVRGLTAGQAYVVSVSSRRYAFTPSVRAVQLFDDLAGFDFVADQ
jgi:hypothetical protein